MEEREAAGIPTMWNPSSSDDLDGQAAMEMTGLMYKPPTSQAELESYKEVYPFSPEQYTEE